MSAPETTKEASGASDEANAGKSSEGTTATKSKTSDNKTSDNKDDTWSAWKGYLGNATDQDFVGWKKEMAGGSKKSK